MTYYSVLDFTRRTVDPNLGDVCLPIVLPGGLKPERFWLGGELYLAHQGGRLPSRTNRVCVTVWRAKDARSIRYTNLLVTTRRGRDYLSCKGVGSWEHLGDALAGIVRDAAATWARQDARIAERAAQAVAA